MSSPNRKKALKKTFKIIIIYLEIILSIIISKQIGSNQNWAKKIMFQDSSFYHKRI